MKLQDILALVLSPKIKKIAKNLKSDPDFIELEKEIETTIKSLDQINKRIERTVKKREDIVKDMNRSGIGVSIDMTPTQIYNEFKRWQAKEAKKIGKPEWAEYFK